MSDDIFNPHPEIAELLGETKSQISPADLPDALPADFPREKYPLPWRVAGHRGNGHVDVEAANGAYVAHIYCWDDADDECLKRKLASINASV